MTEQCKSCFTEVNSTSPAGLCKECVDILANSGAPAAKEDGIPEEPTDLQKTLTSGFKTSITITANDEAEGRRVVSGWRNEDVRQYAINWVARAEARQRLADEAIAALRAMLKPSVVASLQEPEGDAITLERMVQYGHDRVADFQRIVHLPQIQALELELRKLRPQETPQEAWIRAFEYVYRHGWDGELDGRPDYVAPPLPYQEEKETGR